MRRIRDRLISQVVPERNSVLLLVSLSFLAGCLCAFKVTPGLWLWALVGLSALLGLILRRLGAGAGLALVLCFFSLGVLRTQAAFETPQPAPGRYEITGYVCGGTDVREDGRVTFVLSDITLDGEPAQGQAYCSVYGGAVPALFDGAQVRLTGNVYLPERSSGWPHMDFALWLRQSGLSFGVISYDEPEVLNTPATAPVRDGAYRVRQAFTRALEGVMGPSARVAVALLLGERDGLSQEEREAFERLGVAHVMSVSGLHVGLLGGLVLRVLERLRLRRGLRLVALGAFLGGYCALTGFSAASVRAAVMLLLSLLSHRFARRPDRLTALAAAMLFVLATDPLQAWAAGFVLSFSAMLGISLLMPPLERLGARLGNRTGRKILSLLFLSLAAQLGVLLPTAAYFHQLPLYGVFINLLVVPLAGALLTPLSFVTLLCSPIPMLGQVLGWMAARLSELLMWLVSLLSGLPGASVRAASPPLLWGVALAVACALLVGRIPGSPRRRAGAAALTVLIALGGSYLSRPAALRYIQLDVGQADAALVMDGAQTLLIDAGNDGQPVLDYLLAEGRDVDALFITHLHMDHIGGVADLLDAGIRIRQAYIPVNATAQQADAEALSLLSCLRSEGVPVEELACGDALGYDAVSIDVLWPVREHARTGQDANDLPLVLAVSFGPYRILSASDLTGVYERYAAVPADVLKVGHHGSAHSTGECFLAAVSPRIALVSCSGSNSALPAEETLERLRQSGAEILRTDASGDVTLTLRGETLCATPYKAREEP